MNARTLGYGSTTALLAFALFASGAAKLAGAEPMVDSMVHLGYPTYLLSILGFWYLAAAVAVAAPGFARVKEWAYAGVVFAMTGAFASHILAGDPVAQAAPTVLLAGLALTSYTLRPDSRRIVAAAAAPDAVPVATPLPAAA